MTTDVPPGTWELLTRIAEVEAEREAQWLRERRDALKEFRRELPSPAGNTNDARQASRLAHMEEVRARQDQIRRDRARLRAEGELRGTKDLLIAHGLREVLRARGLDKQWPAPPPDQVGVPGRPVGTGNGRVAEIGEVPERLAVRLPDDLVAQARAACYWTSKEAVEGLRAWAAQWGDGPRAVSRALVRVMREGSDEHIDADFLYLHSADGDALAERDALRARVLTLGDLVREAVHLVTTGELPETGLPTSFRG
ncbi:hypothetical protein ACIO3O_36840 [Streptomyces sp. NPDC087440]|uniref:hypothetical protein n=1 Tax=Streptomyces sp. NPDC087440 TaxID=3365790 RepID=UPI00380FFCB4